MSSKHGQKIGTTNSKVIRKSENPTPKPKGTCNCQKCKKTEYTVPEACNQDGAIYEAEVKTEDGYVESYVGLAKNFKKRYPKHTHKGSDKLIYLFNLFCTMILCTINKQ